MNWNPAGLALALPVLLLPVGGNLHSSAAQDTADLALSKVVDKKNAKIGENMTFTITLTNLGPSTAAKSERKFSNTAFISESATTDPNSGNNSASLDLHISGKLP